MTHEHKPRPDGPAGVPETDDSLPDARTVPTVPRARDLAAVTPELDRDLDDDEDD